MTCFGQPHHLQEIHTVYKIPGRKLTAQKTIKRKSDLIFTKTVVIYKVILYSKDVRTAASGVLSLFLLIFWSLCAQFDNSV